MTTLIKRDLMIFRVWDYLILAIIIIGLHFLQFSPAFIFIFGFFSLSGTYFFYDYFYKMNRYFRSLPVKINTIVLSRYMSSLIIMISFLSFQLIIMKTTTLLQLKNYYIYTLNDLFVLSCFAMGIIAVTHLVYYMFRSYFKASILMLFLIMFTTMLLTVLGNTRHTDMTDTGYTVTVNQADLLTTLTVTSGNFSPGILVLITIALLIMSYYIATFLERRKDIA